jgi:hypothetical protein
LADVVAAPSSGCWRPGARRAGVGRKTAERVSVLAKRVLPFRVLEAAPGSLGVG